MRNTTKLAGLVAGAAGLLGGMAMVPEAAHAAPTNVWSCTDIHGTKPADATLGGGAVFYSAVTGLPTPLTNTPQDMKIKLKIDKVQKAGPPAPNPGYSFAGGTCTPGPYLTGIGASVGGAKAFGGSLKGKISCNTSSTYPASIAPVGALTLTFATGTDPASGAPAKATLTAAVTRPAGLVAPPPSTAAPEAVRLHGIITKGVVPGADVNGTVLQEPIAPAGLSPTGSSPWWDDTGAPGSKNGLTPTKNAPADSANASLVAGAICAGGGPGIPSVAFGGDGTSIDGTTVIHVPLTANADT